MDLRVHVERLELKTITIADLASGYVAMSAGRERARENLSSMVSTRGLEIPPLTQHGLHQLAQARRQLAFAGAFCAVIGLLLAGLNALGLTEGRGTLGQWFAGLGTFALGLATFDLSMRTKASGSRPLVLVTGADRVATEIEVANLGPGPAIRCDIQIVFDGDYAPVHAFIPGLAPRQKDQARLSRTVKAWGTATIHITYLRTDGVVHSTVQTAVQDPTANDRPTIHWESFTGPLYG